MTIVFGGLAFRHRLVWRHGGNLLGVGLPVVDGERLAAHGGPHAPSEHVPVVVDHFLPGPVVDDRLRAIQTGALFALVRADGHAAKLDPLHDGPGFFLAFE